MNILLACSAGMSTSMLVTKMEVAAKAQGMEGKIWAVASDMVLENIGEADVLLIGPQVRFMLNQMKKIGDERGVPVAVIESLNYGTMNGKAVLEQAISLVNSK